MVITNSILSLDIIITKRYGPAQAYLKKHIFFITGVEHDSRKDIHHDRSDDINHAAYYF